MIFVTDSKGQTIHASVEWEALTGQKTSEALGRRWLSCVHPEDRKIVVDTLEEALRRTAEFSLRYRLRKPCGAYRWVSAGGVPSLGPPGRAFIGFLGSLVEIEDGAAEDAGAYGSVDRRMRRSSCSAAKADQLNEIADHLMRAYSLIETDESEAAALSLRYALYEVGCALAGRERAQQHSH